MAVAETMRSSLEAIYRKYETLRADSPESDFESFASHFAEDCKVFLRSMREHKTPAINRQGIIQQLHDILKDQYLEKSRVSGQAFDEENMRVFAEIENTYNIHGKILPSFPETCVATFNEDGRVTTLKLYCCRSDIVFLIQKATGAGPYSKVYLDQ